MDDFRAVYDHEMDRFGGAHGLPPEPVFRDLDLYALGRLDTLRLVYIGAAIDGDRERWRRQRLGDLFELRVTTVWYDDLAATALRTLADLGDEVAIEMLGGRS